ncbi:MAG: glycerol-3-phosphate acyltransferase [Chloroflexi bacterium]|nr:glycerol-3-phosphate acyltransferase [Chloroflexota bacterium]MCI0834127.1 glycerol-3-phosphate acyltransferase [Chloroflexota bacterium]
MSSEVTFNTFLISAVIAYAMGAIPVAYIAGRLYGVNIFKVGSRQAGATNVFREVSHRAGFAVTVIDASKGFLAILAVRQLGLDGAELLIPAVAAIAGHWNSPFTKFKGGDGVTSMVGTGIGIAWITLLGPITLGAAIGIGLNRKLSHPSLWGGAAGFLLFIALSFMPSSNTEPAVVYGLTGLGIGVMLHSMYFHRRHREFFSTPDVLEEESDPALTQNGLG